MNCFCVLHMVLSSNGYWHKKWWLGELWFWVNCSKMWGWLWRPNPQGKWLLYEWEQGLLELLLWKLFSWVWTISNTWQTLYFKNIFCNLITWLSQLVFYRRIFHLEIEVFVLLFFFTPLHFPVEKVIVVYNTHLNRWFFFFFYWRSQNMWQWKSAGWINIMGLTG